MKELEKLKQMLIKCIYEVKGDKLSCKKANEISKLAGNVCDIYKIQSDNKGLKNVK